MVDLEFDCFENSLDCLELGVEKRWIAHYQPRGQPKPAARHKSAPRKMKHCDRPPPPPCQPIISPKEGNSPPPTMLKKDGGGGGDDDDDHVLPPFLRNYGRRTRNAREFSGPPVISEESDEGCFEYKLRLSCENSTRFQQLVSQLKYRLAEGGGHCFYCLGVEDNGFPSGLDSSDLTESLAALHEMAREIEAVASVLHYPPGTQGRQCAVVRICRGTVAAITTLEEVRVAVAGAVDGGKSTLISCLSHGADGRPALDNGRGSARTAVLRHKHEIESGRTSCISHRVVGYGGVGEVLNYSRIAQFTPRELTTAARKIVKFSDLGGHQRFSNTSLHGLISTRPDVSMLCVCPTLSLASPQERSSLSWVTLDHLAISLALGVPIFIVLTKIDVVEESAVDQVKKELHSLAAASFQRSTTDGGGSGSGAVLVENVDDALRIATSSEFFTTTNTNTNTTTTSIHSQQILPIFEVSCVTGAGLAVLHAFLNALPTSSTSSSPPSPAHFQVDAAMHVAGVGPVLSGVVVSGRISVGDYLLLGPQEDDGKFCRVMVNGLHRAQVEVASASAGQHATVALATCGGGATMNSSPASSSPSSLSPQSSVEEAPPQTTSPPLPSHNGLCCTSSLDRPGIGGINASNNSSVDQIDPMNVYKRQTSKADLDMLGKSWEFVLGHLDSPPNNNNTTTTNTDECATMIPRARKGTVLLDPGLCPKASFTFDVFVVIFRDKNWPADTPQSSNRNRNSPDGDIDTETGKLIKSGESGGGEDFSDSQAMVADTLKRSSSSPKSQQRSQRPAAYQFMVHCCGVRQPAQVLTCTNFDVDDVENEDDEDDDGCLRGGRAREWMHTVAGGKAAAGVLRGAVDADASSSSSSLLRTAKVRIQFHHRPEWMLPGSRILFRESDSGRVAGVGVSQ